ncbi:tyrosine-type recombinase/integrase [Rugamonas sp. FT29W]|uniref:Tyrosine-type recombinase/integrase n=1 Tax=Rugamonas aquatica TaxID=2743357 RepID=A0A6A7N1Y3_9BURK|nr:tyrosine-type recombinase/integrase [Rugamonas aquatica]
MVDAAKTIGALLDRYSLEELPKKSPRHQVERRRALRNLKAVFGDAPLDWIRPQNVYQYVESRKTTRIAAHRAVDALSHVFTKAVEWGLIDRHPFKGEVRLDGEASRTRYVEDWELIEVLALPSKRKQGSVLMMQAYIRIKLLTGLARSDLLRLNPTEAFKGDGIHVTRHKTAGKTGKSTIYEWNDDLRAAVDAAIAVRSTKVEHLLFCTRAGKSYIHPVKETVSGWDSMWQRFMVRIMKETKLAERFTEHDLRAKCASDAETLEHARALLSHVDSRVTDRIYRRKPERVQPGKIGFE